MVAALGSWKHLEGEHFPVGRDGKQTVGIVSGLQVRHGVQGGTMDLSRGGPGWPSSL